MDFKKNEGKQTDGFVKKYPKKNLWVSKKRRNC